MSDIQELEKRILRLKRDRKYLQLTIDELKSHVESLKDQVVWLRNEITRSRTLK